MNQFKVCKKCKEKKSIEDFHKQKDCSFGRKNSCKSCIKKRRDIYYQKNKKRITQKTKLYNELHKESLREKKIIYYAENKEILSNKSKQKRKEFTPKQSFKVSLYSTIGHGYYRKGFKRDKTLFDIIGMEFEDFYNYIESLFLPGMSWDNRSEWHIDHRIPTSLGNTVEELNKLNHYKNLVPIWKIQNLTKNCKIDIDLLLATINSN